MQLPFDTVRPKHSEKPDSAKSIGAYRKKYEAGEY